jgi:hypothetical protein
VRDVRQQKRCLADSPIALWRIPPALLKKTKAKKHAGGKFQKQQQHERLTITPILTTLVTLPGSRLRTQLISFAGGGGGAAAAGVAATVAVAVVVVVAVDDDDSLVLISEVAETGMKCAHAQAPVAQCDFFSFFFFPSLLGKKKKERET